MWASMADALQPPSDVNDTFAAVQADIFGQTLTMSGPPTNMNLNQALVDFNKEVDSIPPEAKSALVQARRLGADIDGEHVLQFLWATNFNVKVGGKARRAPCNGKLVTYFSTRLNTAERWPRKKWQIIGSSDTGYSALKSFSFHLH